MNKLSEDCVKVIGTLYPVSNTGYSILSYDFSSKKWFTENLTQVKEDNILSIEIVDGQGRLQSVPPYYIRLKQRVPSTSST